MYNTIIRYVYFLLCTHAKKSGFLSMYSTPLPTHSAAPLAPLWSVTMGLFCFISSFDILLFYILHMS